MFNMIISLFTGTFASWFSNKQKLDEIKVKAKIETSKNQLNGYSDEFLVLIWSYPFISLFVPVLAQQTAIAFKSLAMLPDWYVGGFISISFAVFGIDKLFRWKK